MKPTTQRTTSLRGHPGCPPGAVLASSARFKQSTLAGAIKPGRRAVTMVRASAEYDVLKNYPVAKATANEVTNLASLWQPTPGTKVVVAFLTHFADLTSWEYAQRLLKVIPTLESSGVQVVAVGLGSSFNAQEFARVLKFPLDRLYHTQDKSLYRALGFSPGFGEGIEISPYAKLVPMLLGIGSPGTMQEVIRGYVGDKDSKPVFDSPTPFDVLGTGYQRPLELATQRLFNMIGILPKWSELSPPDQELLTQQGGTLAFDGEDVIFKHIDSGILKYTDTDALLRAVLQADYANAAIDVPSITATVSSSSASSRPGQ